MWILNNTSLKRYVRAILLSPRTLGRGFYREGVVSRMLDEEFSDVAVHTEMIGRMITLELAMRLLIDEEDMEFWLPWRFAH